MATGPVAGGRIRFQNCSDIYSLLENKSIKVAGAELIEYGYPAQEDEELLIYKGFSTKEAITSLKLLPSSISHAMSTLKAMHALTLIVSGGPNRPSIYILHYKPTVEQFEEFAGRSIMLERKIAPNRYQSLIDDMVRLREQTAELERKYVAQQNRLDILEGLVNDRNNLRRGETLS